MTLATVLVPTHNHHATLEIAVAFALGQTVRDLEILIVGDGPTEAVRAAGERLAEVDPRIRWFSMPKGERHGEANRHEVLKEARGRLVFYLSDDDLWLPDHVEILSGLFTEIAGDCFLAHTLPTYIETNGQARGIQGSDAQLLAGENHVPLSAMAHTLSAYRRLAVGWSPAPAHVYTDVHMWQKFLAVGYRLAGVAVPTVVHFPSNLRIGWPQEFRRQELSWWARRIATDPAEVRKELLDGAQAL